MRATKPAGIYTVIGTVPHVYARGPEEGDQPSASFALKPDPARVFAGLFVKTSRAPDEMVAAITTELEPVAPLLQEPFVFAADDAVRRITASPRFNALMSLFGFAALLIGTAGIYAVMAAFVAQQTREIGIRTAPLRSKCHPAWDRIQRIHFAEKNSIRTGAMAPGLTL